MAFDAAGTLYVALREGNALYQVEGTSGRWHGAAGTGTAEYFGDDGPARFARLDGLTRQARPQADA